MLFLVYLLLTLNITITFSSVVCKKAFFRLRIAIMAITIYITNAKHKIFFDIFLLILNKPKFWVTLLTLFKQKL